MKNEEKIKHYENVTGKKWDGNSDRIVIENYTKLLYIPDAPKATDVRYNNLPLVSVLPDAPKATVVRYDNLHTFKCVT